LGNYHYEKKSVFIQKKRQMSREFNQPETMATTGYTPTGTRETPGFMSKETTTRDPGSSIQPTNFIGITVNEP
jgi:hypothetical protein